MTVTPLYLTEPITSGMTYGTLSLETDGSYYIIHDASPVVLEMAKRVFPGCDYGRRAKCVRFRATRRAVGDLNWLMTRYPLVIEDRARFDEHRELAIKHAMRIDTNAKKPKKTKPPAAFDGTLYPFQSEGVTYLMQNDRTLLADDMGLGKTVTALATVASIGTFPVLICVPPNVRYQWQKSIGKFLNLKPNGRMARDTSGEDIVDMLLGVNPRPLRDRQLFVTSYNLLPAWKDHIIDRGIKAVVFDEIQELRHTGTHKYSAASLIAEHADRVWGLSGTPIYNYGIEMWSITNILDYHCLGDRESFTREWCEGYGSDIVSNPEVLCDHLRREGLMIRRRKSEVMSQLPPKHRVSHYVDHDTDKYANMIRSAVSLAARYHDITGWQERGKAALEIDNQTRLATGASKAPYAADFVASLIEAGERPLIYAWHHDVHDIVTERLKQYRLGRITGKETAKAKRRAVEKFSGGELDAMLLSLRATAGLDGLQSRATCVVFCELDWSPAVHSQCEDRLHRVGMDEGLDGVMCYYLVSRTGYDGTVMDALGIKVGQFTGIMGDEPDSEDKKQLSEQKASDHLNAVIEALNKEVG